MQKQCAAPARETTLKTAQMTMQERGPVEECLNSGTGPEVAFEEVCRDGKVSRRDEAAVSRSDESFAERRFRRMCSAMAFVKSGGTLFPTRAHLALIPGPQECKTAACSD